MLCMCPEYMRLCDPCSCMFAQHVGVNAIYCIYAVMSVHVFVCVDLCVRLSQWGSKSSRLISSQSPAEQMWGLIRQGIGGGAYALVCLWGRDGPASLKFDKISVCGDIIYIFISSAVLGVCLWMQMYSQFHNCSYSHILSLCWCAVCAVCERFNKCLHL